jgi:hypothetical protein
MLKGLIRVGCCQGLNGLFKRLEIQLTLGLLLATVKPSREPAQNKKKREC